MPNIPNLRVQNLGASLKVLFIDNTDLVRDRRFSYLSENVVATGTTIRVQSIAGFESLTTSSGQIICIGEIGQEKTELLRTSNTTAPSNSYKEVTLRDAMSFDHFQDTKVYIVDWNRIELTYAGTVTGTKNTLEAYPVNVLPDQPSTLYREIAKDSVFYFSRFNDSITNRFSRYSDGVPSGEYDDNSVFMIKQRALDAINEKVDGNLITHNFLDQALWQGRREYHQSPGKRPFRRKFNTNIGTVTVGMFRVALPADVEKPYTAENVFGVRLGTNLNMSYFDKKDFDDSYQGAAHTTLVAANTTADKDLYCDNVDDFKDSGSVLIEDDTIAYSARGIAGGTLRISTAGKTNHANGSDVWQGITGGLPGKFTVFADPGGSAFIYFSSPVGTLYGNLNIFTDYYRTVVDKDTDADALDEPDFDMYTPYLSWRIKQRKNRGLDPLTDSDYQQWQLRKSNALAMEYISTQIRIRPEVDHLPFPS